MASSTQGSSWVTREFSTIPGSVQEAKTRAQIEEKRIKVSVGSDTLDVFFQEAKPCSSTVVYQVPLLLLHGKVFTSQIWNELGTLSFAAASGTRAVAVDLPGYGKTKGSLSGSQSEFLKNFSDAVGVEEPIIVSPSMSGSFSLPFLLEDPASASAKARGYIPVAPVATGHFSADAYQQVTVPSLIVYGSNDTTPHGQVSTKDLKNLPNSRLCCFEGAGHACYMNKPDLWHEVLYNFLSMVEEMQ